MVLGFVILGSLATLGQLLVIGGVYRSLGNRRPLADSTGRVRVRRLVWGGMALLGVGQLLALESIGSLRVAAILTLRRALFLQEAGLVLGLVGSPRHRGIRRACPPNRVIPAF